MNQLLFKKVSIKHSLAPLLWLLYFILSFRVFSRFPIGLIEEAALIGFILLLIYFFTFDVYKSALKGKFIKLHLILLPIVLVPFFNAFQSREFFNQPLLYGILAQRSNFVVLTCAFIVIILRRGWTTIRRVEHFLIIILHLLLFIYFYFNVFVDPANYAGTYLVSYSAAKGYRFMFHGSLIVLLFFYGLFKVWIEKKRAYNITVLLTLLYLVIYGQDRSQLLFVALLCLVFYLRNFSANRKIIYAVYGICFLLIVISGIVIFAPELVSKYTFLFSNAAKVVLGISATESAANVRVLETQIALRGFMQSPWLGTGYLSYQWNGGYLGLYKYFYPADIGVIGNLYVFGIIGTLIYYIPFMAAYSFSKKLRQQFDVMLVTAQYGMLFIFFDMFTEASNIVYIGINSFLFGIVYYYRFYHPETSQPHLNDA